jgi:sodium-dependent phosphate cotransporter
VKEPATEIKHTGRFSLSTLSTRVAFVVRIVGLLYTFLLSVALLGKVFRLFGSGFIEQITISTSDPFLALIIGLVATSIVQSSSATTSLIVGLVAGGAINLEAAIVMVMGANIGTTVTNTIIAMSHISRPDEFQRGYASAVVHDIFNLLAVLIVFPFQVKFNVLGIMAQSLSGVFQSAGGAVFTSPVKAAVEPALDFLVGLARSNPWPLLAIAVFLLVASLHFLVKTLRRVVATRLQVFFDKIVFRHAFTSGLLGLCFTILVQSSSVATSLIVPLAAAGLMTLEQVFPYTLGANVGTTVTAILASLATGSPLAITVAFAHLCFNAVGILIIWPIKFVPLKAARFMALLGLKSRLIPVAVLLGVFYGLPLTIFFIAR